ncbi:sugar ABC transporter ATP-binding protein [Rhizobium sp.]
MVDQEPLLVARNVTKVFGATIALKAFDLAVMPGRIHALIGENGAGKSTFIKTLAGIYKPDEGTIDVVKSSRDHPAIVFIHQDLGLVPEMSAAENVILGHPYPRKAGLIDWQAVSTAAAESLRTVGAEFDPATPVADLAVADRALVAIARAVRLDARILVLDEPTATLPGSDVEKLFTVLNRLKAAGMGMIYVSHRLREVLTIADEVTAVRDGQRSFHGPVAGLTENDLIAHMIGAEAVRRHEREPGKTTAAGDIVLSAKALSVNRLDNVDLEVRRGEIIGCVGLRGAGQEILGRALSGVVDFKGEIRLDGKPYRPRNVDDAMRQGVSFITGDRDIAIVRTMSVEENLFVHPSRTSVPSWLRSRAAERLRTEDAMREYDVRPRDATKSIGDLSGGNAQKVVFARGMESSPKLVVLDDPTAGVDMPTRYALYDMMRVHASKGTSFVVASSDHDEVAAVCDRVYVFRNGRIAHVLDNHPLDAEHIATLTQEEAA